MSEESQGLFSRNEGAIPVAFSIRRTLPWFGSIGFGIITANCWLDAPD